MAKSKTYLVAMTMLALTLLTLPLASPGRAQDRRRGQRVKLFSKGEPQELSLALELSRSVIALNGIDSMEDAQPLRVWVDDQAMAHVHVRQTYRRLPVLGGEMIVHLNDDGTTFGVTDGWQQNIQVETRPALSAGEAARLATAEYGCDGCLTDKPKAELLVLRQDGRDHLAYRVQLRREDGSAETALPVYFIDAQTGQTLWGYNNLQTATGASLYSGTVTIKSYFRSANSTYYLEDVGRRMGTFDYRNTTSSVFRFTDANDVWDSATQRAAVDAHYGAAAVYDYFKNVHGRNGIDGSGGPALYTSIDGVTGLISSRVHYGTNYNNAFWNGTAMTYGDGDASTFSPLVSLDIVGHEMTHGVTERTAGLIYSGESGALNESFSDVFGALIERHITGATGGVWKIGEQVFTPGTPGDALRHMDNPHAASNSGFTADDDPDHYSERYTGTGDNGGVHINSGIPNYVFYLLANGGTHHLGGSMAGIGADDAARIWYRALTTYMTSSTNFAGARTATLNAAAALFGAGSTQHNAVGQAWALCGVGTAGGGGGNGSELLTNGGYEGSASPWVLTGSAFHVATGNFPHGGTGYAYLGSVNSASGAIYQQITIPSAAATANLTFWLNVSSSETTTTTQYDRLFVEVRNTSGALLQTLATFSNLNKATAGSYTQRGAYNLSAYKGQTVRVQFRATTDSSLATTFRLDDVSVK